MGKRKRRGQLILWDGEEEEKSVLILWKGEADDELAVPLLG